MGAFFPYQVILGLVQGPLPKPGVTNTPPRDILRPEKGLRGAFPTAFPGTQGSPCTELAGDGEGRGAGEDLLLWASIGPSGQQGPSAASGAVPERGLPTLLMTTGPTPPAPRAWVRDQEGQLRPLSSWSPHPERVGVAEEAIRRGGGGGGDNSGFQEGAKLRARGH